MDKNIAIDVDGVIFRFGPGDWKGPEYVGPLIPGVHGALLALRSFGYRIVLYSCRTDMEVMGQPTTRLIRLLVEHLKRHEIPYDEIAIGKPIADFYIDDRGIRFESWPQAMGEVIKEMNRMEHPIKEDTDETTG